MFQNLTSGGFGFLPPAVNRARIASEVMMRAIPANGKRPTDVASWLAPALTICEMYDSEERGRWLEELMIRTMYDKLSAERQDVPNIGSLPGAKRMRRERFAAFAAKIRNDGGESIRLNSGEKQNMLYLINGSLVADAQTAVLYALDHSLAETPVVHANVSKEHVIPQNPNANSDWGSIFTDEQRLARLHTLGNLALCGRKNPQMSNRSFSEKRKIFFPAPNSMRDDSVSPLPINESLRGYSRFTEVEYQERHSYLVRKLAAAWRLGTLT